jgi:hypothetical protein
MLINEFMSHDVCSSLVLLSEMDKEFKETALLEYLDEMDVRYTHFIQQLIYFNAAAHSKFSTKKKRKKCESYSDLATLLPVLR